MNERQAQEQKRMQAHMKALDYDLQRLHNRFPMAPLVHCQHFFPSGHDTCSECGAKALQTIDP